MEDFLDVEPNNVERSEDFGDDLLNAGDGDEPNVIDFEYIGSACDSGT